MARRFKVDRSEVVLMWKAMKATNPRYTKIGLARFFGVSHQTITTILREAIVRGDLPESTFTDKYARRKNQRADS